EPLHELVASVDLEDAVCTCPILDVSLEAILLLLRTGECETQQR
ncbi:MAG: hypothetical protein RL701_1346, partial [Pseudomonadota bacterium]